MGDKNQQSLFEEEEFEISVDPRNSNYEEDESDSIKQLDAKSFSDAVVTGTDWTTETILNQLKKGNINISPKFQRRDAWTKTRKSKFIESILLGIPIPQIILAEQKKERGRFIVIDGKQRLLALRQFIAEPDEDFVQLKLSGLEYLKNLNGITYSELLNNPKFSKSLNEFQNYPIRTAVIKNWRKSAYLHVIFLRLNTGSVQLSPQELRLALLPGPFMNFIDDFAINSVQIQKILNLKSNQPDRRMRDVEYAIRFFANKYFIKKYRGNLKEFLDFTCETLNDNWKKDEQKIHDTATSLNMAIDTTYDIFAENSFKKFNLDSEYETRTNRAVFDIMTFYFSNHKIAKEAREQSAKVKTAFQELCQEDNDFLRALETSTKNINPTQTRFQSWGEKLRGILGDVVDDIPMIEALEEKPLKNAIERV